MIVKAPPERGRHGASPDRGAVSLIRGLVVHGRLKVRKKTQCTRAPPRAYSMLLSAEALVLSALFSAPKDADGRLA